MILTRLFYTGARLKWTISRSRFPFVYPRRWQGFIGVHSATITFPKWPEYVGMVGGSFDQHPWGRSTRVLVEDAAFPGMRQWTRSFTLKTRSIR